MSRVAYREAFVYIQSKSGKSVFWIIQILPVLGADFQAKIFSIIIEKRKINGNSLSTKNEH